MTPEDRVRAALAAYAVTVQPRPALSLIQDRCKTAAPEAPGTAAMAPDCEGVEAAMSIPHHEALTVLGQAVVQHTLSGRPTFEGLVDSPDGPMVRLRDGDLVLHVDDVETLIRWRNVFEVAAVQLSKARQRHEERQAREESR